MRIFSISPEGVTETDALPQQPPAHGYVWIACTRAEFEARQGEIQSALLALTGATLVDLHVSDLLNAQLTSHYEATSAYDLLVFRRLATGQGDGAAGAAGEPPLPLRKRSGPPVLAASTPRRSALPYSTRRC